MDSGFWRGKRVFLTGHTGFKGSWLSLWLQELGAEVQGFALEPPTDPSMFETCRVSEGMRSEIGDVRDNGRLSVTLREAAPEIVIHMAAQALVRASYREPLATYETNVIGTANLLEAVRTTEGVRVVVVVTTDKCYENREWQWGYRETDTLGGHDPYSNSKACAELVTASYRASFFNTERFDDHRVAVASARAGNVIGGGDWAEDRLIPDAVKAIMAQRPVLIRNPQAIRPWQHVLEPLGAYLTLAERLWNDGPQFSEAWNFGPRDEDARPVSWVMDRLTGMWGDGARWEIEGGDHPHETSYLKLDISMARSLLGWAPRLNIEQSLEWVHEWYLAYSRGMDVRDLTRRQITRFTAGD